MLQELIESILALFWLLGVALSYAYSDKALVAYVVISFCIFMYIHRDKWTWK